jgi:hypothetical protein
MEEKQISTKAFILSIVEVFKYLGKYWQLLLIALLLGTAFDLVKSFFFAPPKKYDAKIVFHLELEGGGATNQLGGLASSFGLGGTGGGGGGDLFGAANFEAIVTSGNVFQKAFMKEIMVGDKKELFINYFIDSSDIKTNEWGKTLFHGPSDYCKYRFTKKTAAEFTPYENMIFADVYTKLYETTKINPQDNSSLFELSSQTSNEILTKRWVEVLLESTEEFYKEMKTKKTRQLLTIQEKRLDSLSYLIKTMDKKIARITFDNPNVVDPGGILKQQQTNRDNTYITNQYLTQMANVEALNRMIIEQTPIFTILEPVRLPLGMIEKSGLNTRLGGVIALLAVIFILLIIRSIKDVLSDKA